MHVAVPPVEAVQDYVHSVVLEAFSNGIAMLHNRTAVWHFDQVTVELETIRYREQQLTVTAVLSAVIPAE